MTRVLPRLRTRSRRDPLLSALGAVGNFARWLTRHIPEPRVIERYSGHFGSDEGERIPYDQMTAEQHRQAAAFWSGIYEEQR